MPYIKDQQRTYFDDLTKVLDHTIISDAGEMNYILTLVINQYFANKSKNYAAINDVIGAIECCKHEFIRRVVSPYEDIKIESNGDVYKDNVLLL